MQIINVSVDKLVEYETNPRFNDEAVEQVANSIKEFGFKVPVTIDKNNVIITGHTRVKAARRLGMVEVPAIRVEDLSDEQIKAFRLVDNKTSEFADWDTELLAFEMLEIEDIDMSDFGFDVYDMDDFGEEFSLTNIDEPLSATMTFTLSVRQRDIIEGYLKLVDVSDMSKEENSNKMGNALYKVVEEWAQKQEILD